VIATLKLMAYLKQTDRRETYIKYVHLLCNLHLCSNPPNFVEAALTILLHADLLQWDDETILDSFGTFGKETSGARKAKIYKQAITYFDKGKTWERGIDLIKQLCNYYEKIAFDYSPLSDLLRTEAEYFTKINETDRFFAEYFRVSYYGKGFPPSIQGREFIYRGFELEKAGDFLTRITAKFPKAEIYKGTEAPPANVINSEGQFISISAVQPSTEDEMNGTTPKLDKLEKMPEKVEKYHKVNNVNIFVLKRSFRKNKALENEFADLWITNTYLITEDTFPTIHRRSEVIKKVEVTLSPVENAVNSIKDKNKELTLNIQKYYLIKEYASPFTMLLNGVIDAAVNGGVERYAAAFMSTAFIKQNPDKKQLVDSLKEDFKKQANLLEKGLLIHKQLCPETMLALHQKMETLFYEGPPFALQKLLLNPVMNQK